MWRFNDYNQWDKTINNSVRTLVMNNAIKENNINLTEFIHNLALLPNLERLSIINNNITTINDDLFENCPKLINFDCSNNNIDSLAGIEKCPKLNHLGCTNNKLTSMSDIIKCKRLQVIYCADNSIESLNNIEDLSILSNLYCMNNNITSIQNIIDGLLTGKLQDLETLNIEGNNIPQSQINELINLNHIDIVRYDEYTNPVAPNYMDEPVPVIDTEPNPAILSIFKNVFCLNYIDGDDETIDQFLEDQKSEGPFIVEFNNNYTGNALNWLLREFNDTNDPKEFIECKDNTPEEWQGNAYSRYVKEGGRTFVNVKIRGSNVLVEKPDWFWKGPVPTAKIFQLIKQAPVKKYMTNYLLPMRPDFSALGSAHCQPSNVDTYKLVEVNESNAQQIADNANHKQSGGKRRRLNKKTVKTIKSYKKRKTNKKKINKKTTNKKTTNKKTIKSYKKRKTNKKTTNKKTTNKKTTNKKTIKTNKIV